jgi:molybdate-binding protein
VQHLLIDRRVRLLADLEGDVLDLSQPSARSAVLATGNHAGGFPTHVGDARVARIHLVRREVGLVARAQPPSLEPRRTMPLASRPPTAGVRMHLDAALAG